MKAIIQTQGKQFAVNEGDVLTVDRLAGSETGGAVTIDQVLALGEGEEAKIGAPFVDGASVSATVLENKRGKKLVVYKKKKRKGYERTRGHRQELSVIRIDSIKG